MTATLEAALRVKLQVVEQGLDEWSHEISLQQQQQASASNNHTGWPFVTVPHFDTWARHKQIQWQAHAVALAPLVNASYLDAWSNYTRQVQLAKWREQAEQSATWFDLTTEQQEAWRQQAENQTMTPIFRLDDQGQVVLERDSIGEKQQNKIGSQF